MEDLERKTIRVRGETSYEERLKKPKKNRLDMTIQFHHNVSTVEIIWHVAKGRTDITAAGSNVVLLNRRYYPDIRIAFPIEERQSEGWAAKKGDGALLDKIKTFFDKNEQPCGNLRGITSASLRYADNGEFIDSSYELVGEEDAQSWQKSSRSVTMQELTISPEIARRQTFFQGSPEVD